MARLPADEVGRGNQDPQLSESIPAVSTSFTINFASDLVNTDFPTAGATSFKFSIPIVSGDTDTFTTIEVHNGGTATTGNRSANVSTDTTLSAIILKVRAAIIFSGGTDSIPSNYDCTVNGDSLNVSLRSAGVSVAPSITTDITAGDVTISDIDLGHDAEAIVEPQYRFEGPFSNIIPVSDPLQGLATVANLYSDFLKEFSNAADDAALATSFSNLNSALDTMFPRNFTSNGILRDASAVGKIAIKGTRRDSLGFVGRGRRSISDTFVNDTANRSVRQLILRVYDGIRDLFNVVSGVDGTISFASAKVFANRIEDDFNIEMGELSRVLGGSLGLYENTIVDRSGDQGLLIYSDILKDIISPTTAITTYALFQSSAATERTAGNLQRLRLKN